MDNIMEIKNITKVFPGTIALNDVSFNIRRGDIHAIVGENGAGKSTLMKILAGAYIPESGSIVYNGKEYLKLNTNLADEIGIRIVYQELNQVPELTIADNIFLGQEKFFLDDKNTEIKAKELLVVLGLKDVSPNEKIKNLSIGTRQLVEIAKATYKMPQFIIMDEPTSSLSKNEIDILFKYIYRLKNNGCTIIYISHKLDEIMNIADTVTVLRDGIHIKTLPKSEITIDLMIKMMANRQMNEKFPLRNVKPGEVILEVSNIYKEGLVKEASFNLRLGEILGFTGLMGCGRTELMETIFGVHGKYSGEVLIKGKKVNIKCVHDAVNAGFGFVTEDRKRTGIVGQMSVGNNITLVNLNYMLKLKLFTNKIKEEEACIEYKNKLKIKTPTFRKPIRELSGGNQQKVIISKWMLKQPMILIMDEPTRGIDVGSKYEIYEIMNSLTAQGISIIFISSEIEEIVGMCDRVMVVSDNKIIARLNKEDISADNILQESFKGENDYEAKCIN